MSLGARIKEERQRLGLNQTAFAAIAGASKRAMVNWEKDDTSPLASQLLAWGDYGADITYILTGSRGQGSDDDGSDEVGPRLAAIRKDLLDPSRDDVSASERPGLEFLVAALRSAASSRQPKIREEAEELLEVVHNPNYLRTLRIEAHSAQRKRRELERQRLAEWFEGGEYQPGGEVLHLLVTISVEYTVPARLLVDLVEGVRADCTANTTRKQGEGGAQDRRG